MAEKLSDRFVKDILPAFSMAGIALIGVQEHHNSERTAQIIAEQKQVIQEQLNTAGIIECHIPHPRDPGSIIATITAKLNAQGQLVVSKVHYTPHESDKPLDERDKSNAGYTFPEGGGVIPSGKGGAISSEVYSSGFHANIAATFLKVLKVCLDKDNVTARA